MLLHTRPPTTPKRLFCSGVGRLILHGVSGIQRANFSFFYVKGDEVYNDDPGHTKFFFRFLILRIPLRRFFVACFFLPRRGFFFFFDSASPSGLLPPLPEQPTYSAAFFKCSLNEPPVGTSRLWSSPLGDLFLYYRGGSGVMTSFGRWEWIFWGEKERESRYPHSKSACPV